LGIDYYPLFIKSQNQIGISFALILILLVYGDQTIMRWMMEMKCTLNDTTRGTCRTNV